VAGAEKALARINEAGLRRGALAAVLPQGFKSGLFEGLTPSEIQAVLAAARLRRIFPGEVLLHEGEPATHSFLMVTGRAIAYRLTDEGDECFLRWVVPGDTFGFTALRRKPQPSVATVEALRKGSVGVWDWVCALALASQLPKLRENAYSVAANYLGSLADVLIARASQTAQQRLARMLVESSRQIGHAGREGIEIDLTNEELAAIAGVGLFTASRQLSEWQRQGILTKSRGRILLRSPERLIEDQP